MKNWDRDESGSEFDDDESLMSSSSDQQQLQKCNSQEQQGTSKTLMEKNGDDKEEEIPCTLHSRFVILPDQMVNAKHRKSAGYMCPEFYRLMLFRIYPYKFNPVSTAVEKKMLKQINKCWHPMITQTVLDNDEIAPAPSVAHNRLYRYECFDCFFQLNGFPFVPLVYLICDHFIDCPTHLVQPDIREKFLRERESFHAFFGPDFNHDFLLPTDGSAILTFHPFHPLDIYTVKMSPDYCAKRAQQFEEWLEKDYALIHDEEFVEEIEDEEEDEVEDEEDENEEDEEMMEMEEANDVYAEEMEEKIEETVKEVVLATNLSTHYKTKEVGHPIKKKAEENVTPTCEHCGKTFEKQWQLNRHLRKHTLPFECDWPGCWKRFSQKGHCQNHRKTHRDGRPIKEKAEENVTPTCEHCGETFSKHWQLNLHVRKHTLPFECDWPGCERKFPSNDKCKRHEKTHQNDSPKKKNEKISPSRIFNW